MRLITKLWATLLLLCVAGVASAATEYEVDQKFTSVAALEGQLFAIVNETDGKAIYNKDAQNLAYDTYANAIAGTAYLYKLHSLAEESDANVQNAYAIEVVKADGSSIGLWGNPAIYLNSGAEGGFDGCFVLGNKDQYGTDVKYGGAWEIEYAEGQGFALKNVARGGYFAGVNPAPTGTDPIYWTLCTMKEAPQTDPLADQKDALTAAIAKGKMFNALAYTDATFTTLTTKIADGETALAAEGATAESLTAATTAINDAITALAFKEGFSSLKDVPFGKWDGWGADAQQTSTYNTTWELFKTTGQSYGDPGVNDYADLSAFDKLYVTVASGTPRILLNRDADNGQWNATEAESHLIDNTVGDADSWHQKYFAKEGNVYSVDLKQLTTDKGFAHLHSIKSRDNNVVTGLFLYKAPAAAVTTEVTFDFDGGNHAASSNSSHDGDITEDEILTQDGVTMTITPSGGSTANRYWGTSPKMRMYGGTMTIAAPEGKAITKVIYNNGKWNAANTINGIVAEKGEWTGNSTNVVLSVSANTQIKNVIVTVADKNDETTTFTPAEPVHIANTAETAYTVAEAIALIEAGEALSETVFVKGIISKIEKVNVDAEDATKNYITYWISADGTEEGQQFECFKGLTMEGVAYTDIKVGAEVIVKGILTKYQETYEFKQNNELVSYVAPVEPTETIAATLIKPTTGIATEFTSVADLTGVNFAIINKEEGKALYGSNNQNLAYDTYASAFSSSNSGYLWKLVSLADDADADVHEYYRFQLITPTGADYNCWGMGGWLNSQPANKDCSFILGLDNKNGQDIKNGAVYDVQYVEGKGFTIKNIGTGLYQGANNGPAKNEEPTYFTFATVSNTYVPAVEALLAEGAKYKTIVKDEAALTAYNTAIAGIDVTAITGDGLEEAKKVDAAITELAKAVPAVAGQVYTRTIVNPSFEFGNIDGWTSKDGGNSANNGNFHQATGSFFVEKWTNSANGGKLSDGSLTQVIAGLPAGKYKLTAEMQNLEQGNGDAAGKGFYLIANTDSMAVAVSGETVTVETELARKADLTIGAVMKGCTGNWVCVDNFQLTLVEPAPIPTLYAITIAETQNGTVTANPTQAKAGDAVALTIEPASGYEVDQITVKNGEENVAVENNQFTMPAGDVTVTVTFKAIDYTITVTQGENGTIEADKTTAHVGDVVTLTNTPKEDYVFVSYTVTDAEGNPVTVENNKFTMPASNVTVTATFRALEVTYSIKWGEGDNWSTVNEIGMTKGADGKWISTQATEMTATSQFKVYKSVRDGETLSSETWLGKEYQVTELPATIEGLAEETPNITLSKAGTYSFSYDPVTNILVVTGEIEPEKYTITVAEGIEHGTVVPDKTEAAAGETVTLTVAPAEGYELETLTVMNGETAVEVTNNTFVMPAGDVTITATFKESIVNYNLTWSVTPAEGGTVEIKAGETVLTTSPAQVAAGTHITITPSPAQGYEVESVKVNGTPLLTIDDDETGGEFGAPALKDFPGGISAGFGTYGFDMAKDAEVVVTFKKTEYTITVTEPQNGAVVPSVTTANMGDEITLTITPATGYEIDEVTVMAGEDEVELDSDYKFTMPASDVTVTVTFKAITYELEGVAFTTERHWATYYNERDLALPLGMKAYVVDAINGDATEITEIPYIPAGVGVLLYSETAGENFTTVAYTGETDTYTTKLVGSNEAQEIAAGAGYVLYNNYFILSEGGTVAAHRCYLPVQTTMGAPRTLKIGQNGTVSAIETLIAEGNVAAVKYVNLSGMTSDQPFNGVNIAVVTFTDGTTRTIKLVK